MVISMPNCDLHLLPSRGTRIESCDFIVLIGDP